MIAAQHYNELPELMFDVSSPTPCPAPSMLKVNRALLEELGIDSQWFCSDDGLAILSGNHYDASNPPIALAYGGHQFGQWVPLLGDGRAHMLGQIQGRQFSVDVQLKGSGRTRFSRSGDGRATLGSVLREYIVSEAMAALDIPTTRSLAMVGTGEPVIREQPHPGAILVRTARSHIRIGSFEYAASHGQGAVQSLADFVIDKYFPEFRDHDNQYLSLLEEVIARQASLVARWMLVGFIHGVMNTDNTSIVGETIDYGPCAFLDEFNPNKVFSSIDRFGRYAWNQQPAIAHWNLTRLAEVLLPLLSDTLDTSTSLATEALSQFAPRFQAAFDRGISRKLGLPQTVAASTPFVQETFKAMAENTIDFTVFFDHLTRVTAGEPDTLIEELFKDRQAGTDWLVQWREQIRNGHADWSVMRRANPAVIARNHRVEEAIQAAMSDQNFAPFRTLCRVLRDPYNIDRSRTHYQIPPAPDERVTQTFCGT